MTRLSIDDQISDLPGRECRSVGEAIEALLSSLPPDRVVTGIFLDGRRLSDYERNRGLAGDLSSVESLQIRTSSRGVWVAGGLDLAASTIQSIQRSLVRTGELIDAGDRSAADRSFLHCIEGLERFSETVTIARCVLGIDFTRVYVEGIPLSQIESELARIVREVARYRDEGDIDSITERVEYALLTNLSLWKQALGQLRARYQSCQD